MKIALTIAGYDPSSGAGVTADLMVFAAHGLFGTSALTALTVQSTLGVQSTHAVESEVLRATLACLHADLPPAGIKIGMLATAANVAAVCDYLELSGRAIWPVVLDPILESSSGRELLDSEGLDLLRSRLLPLVDWVTPNLAELSLLTGQTVSRREHLPRAAKSLMESVSRSRSAEPLGVFATGGHLSPPDDFLLTPAGEEIWLPGERIETRATHGTGCALASSFLGELVTRRDPLAAALAAKHYVAESMRRAVPIGSGDGPMNLLWRMPPTGDE